MTYQVRGPDPDGDWFVVLVDGDNERQLDEAYPTRARAQSAANWMNVNPDRAEKR